MVIAIARATTTRQLVFPRRGRKKKKKKGRKERRNNHHFDNEEREGKRNYQGKSRVTRPIAISRVHTTL